ncbi:MAG: molybdopterin dehydrogenase FAD-binding protein [Acidobacteria bacterium]|nr:molybdopterin dehydrogenase FAD-binding protein [Acidobacteriota bacterium]
MKAFYHVNAKSLAEAGTALAERGPASAGKATLIAGGTDLIGTLKDNILPIYPTTLVNIKTIPGLDFIKEEAGTLKIGAATRLADIAANPVVKEKYTALSQAALRVATPHVRDMGTIGGNLAQLHRCWYFRKPENRFNCIRKGGTTCFAMAGDNRYHSIFGAVNKCIAVHPSDVAPALVALNAKVVTNRRTIEAENFFDVKIPGNTVLAAGEIITEIRIPAPPAGAKSAFLKFAIRKSIDFPIVNCAVMVGGGSPRICLNAVAPKPYRAVKAEAAIAGKPVSEANAEAAGEAAVADARPLPASKFKVQIAKTLVKRALLAAV